MNILKVLFLGVVLMLWEAVSVAQGVSIGAPAPNPNAVLELVSPTNDQGLLVPKMTTEQRTAFSFTSQLSTTENGLLVYDSDENGFYFWDGGAWVPMQTELSFTSGAGIAISGGEISNTGDLDATNELQNLSLTGNQLNITNGNTVNLSAVDTDTQLSDADISAFGYLKNADDADSDPTNEIQDISFNTSTSTVALTRPGAPDQTIDLSSLAGGGGLVANDPPNGNIFGGTNAGTSLAPGVGLTGKNNTFFGEQAGASNTTGNSNTFVGNLAGRNWGTLWPHQDTV